jgi:hypothetical protein
MKFSFSDEFKADILIVMGLALFGAGLLLWWGLPQALFGMGVITLLMGIAVNIAKRPVRKR